MLRFLSSVFSVQAPGTHTSGAQTNSPATPGSHYQRVDNSIAPGVIPPTCTPFVLQTTGVVPDHPACLPSPPRHRRPALLAGWLLAGLLMPPLVMASATSTTGTTGASGAPRPQAANTMGHDAGRPSPLRLAQTLPPTPLAQTRTPMAPAAAQPLHLAAADNSGRSASDGDRASSSPPAADAAGGGSGRFVLGEELPKAAPAAPAQRTSGNQDGTGDGADPQAAAEYRPMDWETLIPTDWEPLKDFKSLDFSSMSDSDPRAIAALRKLQKAWKHAPLNPAIQNEKIEISGFIVPLDSSDSTTIEEFLLVPYFGACIHVPPPPSNQVIHVTLDKPLQGFQMMDPVTVTGALKPSHVDTPFGSAGYQLSAREVRPYEEADEEAAPAHP